MSTLMSTSDCIMTWCLHKTEQKKPHLNSSCKVKEVNTVSFYRKELKIKSNEINHHSEFGRALVKNRSFNHYATPLTITFEGRSRLLLKIYILYLGSQYQKSIKNYTKFYLDNVFVLKAENSRNLSRSADLKTICLRNLYFRKIRIGRSSKQELAFLSKSTGAAYLVGKRL